MSLVRQLSKLLERAYRRIAELEKENKDLRAWVSKLTEPK